MTSWLDPRLRLIDQELRFRESSLTRDRRVARVLIAVGITFHAASVPWDLSVLETPAAAAPVWAIRAVFIAFSLAIFGLVTRARTITAFDRTTAAWTALLLGSSLAANGYFPPEYANFVAWDVLLLVIVYAVVPLPFTYQFTLATLFTAGSLAALVFVHPFEAAGGLTDVVLVYLCANTVGGFGAWELHRSRREQFVALILENEARVGLEKALAEVRTLRGIIPICANCKQIRTDEGVWRQVEAYVRDHSEAEFSHGICPPCERTFYGELDEPVVEV